jgi:hypothetical protein
MKSSIIDAAHLTFVQLKGDRIIASFREATQAHEKVLAASQRLYDCPELFFVKLGL